MFKASVVRGVVASVFVISAAAAGLAGATSAAAGPAVPPPNCTLPPPTDGVDATVAPVPQDGRCATLRVTKTVTGTPAPGTTFSIVVDCAPLERDGIIPAPEASAADALPPGQNPPFTTTLTFPENGGTQDVLITRSSDCTTSETPPPGCTLTSIDPATTEVRDDIVYPVTVTNDCPPPTPEPAAAAAAAAAPVVEAPRFTG
jgi:hypothetical protein